tara:strand:- start:1777 stop:2310 length:534 start_codon:yes stop_codon:yes gene_type:complete
MRCFVGFQVGQEVKDKVYDVQRSFGNLAKVKWTTKKNLHATLKFLGEIDEDKLEDVKEALSRIEFDAFKLKVGRIGVFPSWGNVKIVWLSLLPEKEIVALQQKVDGELLNLVGGDQNFQAHLTIGKIKQVKKKDEFIKKLKNIKVDGSFDVNSFGLYKSVLSKDGAKHFLLEEYKSF